MGLTDYSRMDKEFFESGVRAERERIIKLLEYRKLNMLISRSPEDYMNLWVDGIVIQSIDCDIGLIKGEQA